jgi:hypothetical protein
VTLDVEAPNDDAVADPRADHHSRRVVGERHVSIRLRRQDCGAAVAVRTDAPAGVVEAKDELVFLAASTAAAEDEGVAIAGGGEPFEIGVDGRWHLDDAAVAIGTVEPGGAGRRGGHRRERREPKQQCRRDPGAHGVPSMSREAPAPPSSPEPPAAHSR